MADIRINALTEASASVTTDFLPIDGSTGTRKLSAFNPTFGGNATVGGTLTVNSSSIVNGSASGATSYLQIKNNGSSIGLLGSRNAIDGGTATDVGLYVYGANALTLWTNSSVVATFASNGSTTLAGAASVGGALFVTGVATFSDNTNYSASVRWANLSGGGTNNFINGATVANTIRFGIGDANAAYLTNTGFQVLATTASTSTSSGALVVGNGTSGGLGVGGAIYAGGALTAAGYSRFTGNTTGGGSDVWVGAAGDGGVFVNTPAGESIYFGINNTPTVTIATGTTTFAATTASTSTSSGALVVSGGVGVAGAIYAGGVLSTVSGAGFNTPDWRFYQSGTSGYIRDLVNGQMALQFVSGNASTIQVYATGTQDSTTTTSGALISAGGLGVAGAVNAGTFFGLVDGVTAPSTAGGYARIYVDTADGDLKVKFGDGTVKTIATDS
jgi:hypothetical protein